MINRVVLVGRLTRDPEQKQSTSGNSICTFTIALDNRGKTADGQKTTSFIPCVVYGQAADTVLKYARGGMLVGVEGRLNQRSYVRRTDGNKASVIEVICDSVQFLEKRKPVENEEMEVPPFDDGVQAEMPAPIAQSSVASDEPEEEHLEALDSTLTDNDLPF